ncbi:hypothetical protein [Azospirillum brasilense]|uniref:hypothetical protein n=1 Tax=Azospirillum brasilense TaxID=192 RepID=UPI001B3B8929|nr:hypothetical protein [Azospirillum brasilense]
MNADAMLKRIEGFNQARGSGVIVCKVARGYTLLSKRTRAPVARLRPTGDGDTVQVLWWNGERWGASGPFGIATMALDCALDYIANEPGFWSHA